MKNINRLASTGYTVKLAALVLFAALLLPTAAAAQNDNGHIAITPYVSEELNLHETVHNTLYQRLTQLVTSNGFGSHSYDFVLLPNILLLDKSVTATAPAKHIVELEISLYVVAVAERVVIGEQSITAKGMGNNDMQAYNAAIKSINFRSPAMRSFISTVRDKIIDYYHDRIPVLMAKAKQLADSGDYEGALQVLGPIPESVDGYVSVIEYMQGLYQNKIDLEAEKALNRVDVLLVKGEVDEALDILSEIDPLSSHYEKAKGKVKSIKAAIDAQVAAAAAAKAEQQELEMEERARQLDMQRAEAMRTATQSASKPVLTDGGWGDFLIGCVKDLAIGFITRK